MGDKKSIIHVKNKTAKWQKSFLISNYYKWNEWNFPIERQRWADQIKNMLQLCYVSWIIAHEIMLNIINHWGNENLIILISLTKMFKDMLWVCVCTVTKNLGSNKCLIPRIQRWYFVYLYCISCHELVMLSLLLESLVYLNLIRL